MEKLAVFSFLTVLFLLFSSLTSFSVSSEENGQLYNISGNVFTSSGDKACNTFVKLIPRDSVQTGNGGTYEITDVTSGEHTIRAYFLDNGHTTSYRKVFINQDMVLDWYEGHNWVTAEMFNSNGSFLDDSPMSTLKLIEANQSKSALNGRVEFGPFEIGQYYTLRAYYGDIDHSTQYVHFRMEGSTPNDFDFRHGTNSKYGYITSSDGAPMSGITVSNGTFETQTNNDGFFIINGLEVGSTQQFTFRSGNIEVAPHQIVNVATGSGWMNISAPEKIRYPDPPTFITETQSIPLSMLPIDIEWVGGDNTLFYTLSSNGEEVYEGFSESFMFDSDESGIFEFQIGATNTNGTTNSTQKLLILVLPELSSGDSWKPGMSWDYNIQYTPTSVSPDPDGVHKVKFTVLGKETVLDAYGSKKNTFLLRKNDEYYMDKEKSYRWVDSQNLLPVKTYWEDDPSSSSYFTQGTMGWNFTDGNGQPTNIFDTSSGSIFLHFNRTNIIGVPGHPNGYDDTTNSVIITENVMISTPAGNFSTTHISIVDDRDGIISWELWYNDTVKNWVKRIDRLPGSHAEKVEFTLSGYDLPLTPKFITEDGISLDSNDYTVEWSPFQGAISYRLTQNGELVYNGNGTNFSFENQNNGLYIYELFAVLPSEASIKSDSINVIISFIPPVPTFTTVSQTIDSSKVINLTWEYFEDVLWYSVVVENVYGQKTEVYNGSNNFTDLKGLEDGQNRVRVQAFLTNGFLSDFSASIFIVVESEVEEASMLSVINVVFIIAIVSILGRKNKL
ncbi:MAG: hypothetical protein CMB63_07315 [Euryarchaeota archaeon]|nr:hypothetical protein [Euryarchaeota archaeon]